MDLKTRYPKRLSCGLICGYGFKNCRCLFFSNDNHLACLCKPLVPFTINIVKKLTYIQIHPILIGNGNRDKCVKTINV